MKISAPVGGPRVGAAAAPAGGERQVETVPTPVSSGFSRGQLLQGRVLGLNPAGESLLALGERVVAFRAPLPLPVGEELWLEVVDPGTPLLLAAAGRKGVTAELLRLLFPERAALAKAAALLTAGDSAPLAAMAADGQADPKKLLKLLVAFAAGGRLPHGKEGGLPSLLSQLPEFAQEQVPGPEKPEAGLTKLAKAVTLMAELNRQPPAAEQPSLYLAPCFFAGSAGWGEWLFAGGREEGGGGEERYGLSFYLEMSKLGELHLQVNVRPQALQGQFSVNSPEVLAHLQSQVPELESLLAGLGYPSAHFACRLAPCDQLLELKKELEEKAALVPRGLVNVVV